LIGWCSTARMLLRREERASPLSPCQHGSHRLESSLSMWICSTRSFCLSLSLNILSSPFIFLVIINLMNEDLVNLLRYLYLYTHGDTPFSANGTFPCVYRRTRAFAQMQSRGNFSIVVWIIC
jgi:hypothetical protein